MYSEVESLQKAVFLISPTLIALAVSCVLVPMELRWAGHQPPPLSDRFSSYVRSHINQSVVVTVSEWEQNDSCSCSWKAHGQTEFLIARSGKFY